MPSPAAIRFHEGLDKGRILRRVAGGKSSVGDRQVHYHASLAATVAAWESYIHAIVAVFFAEISAPSSYGFHALHTIAREEAARRLERFHTPNWENTRALLVYSVGYDPIHDWIWTRRGLGTQQVREFMNEILRVRHSFAHGHSMPSYSWNRSKSGRVRLTAAGLQRIEAFFTYMVMSTDIGIARLVLSQYGRKTTWL